MAGLTNELAECQRQFRGNRLEADEICNGLSNREFNLRPAPDRWSVAECLVHLNITGRTYVERINSATSRARDKNMVGKVPYRPGWLARWMIRAMAPPPRRRYKTPRRFVAPTAEHNVVQVLDEFTLVGEQWDTCLRAASGLHLARVKVRSPAVRWLRFPLGALFAMMAAHERRHLWQARQVTGPTTFISSEEQR